MDDNDDIKKLEYTSKIKKEIEDYLGLKESWLNWISSYIGLPFEYVADKVVPEDVTKQMQTAFLKAFGILNDAAQYTFSFSNICKEFKSKGIEVTSREEIKKVRLEICDKIAQSFITDNKLFAALEGGGTGVGGFALMAVDIPTLMTINFRMISQIANSFGYDTETEVEKMYIMNIISVANANQAIKMQVWRQLNKISNILIKNPGIGMNIFYNIVNQLGLKEPAWKELEQISLVKLIQEVAEKLGIKLTKRKLAQLVPILGGVVGAGMNYSFTLDNGIAALMAYRQRRIDELETFITTEFEENK